MTALSSNFFDNVNAINKMTRYQNRNEPYLRNIGTNDNYNKEWIKWGVIYEWIIKSIDNQYKGKYAKDSNMAL